MANRLQFAPRSAYGAKSDNGKAPLMKKSVIALIAGTACLFAASVASADNIGSDKPIATANDSFTALDRNNDHRLSRSEAGFDRLLSQTFAEIDTDADGFVTLGEFAASEKVRAAATNFATR